MLQKPQYKTQKQFDPWQSLPQGRHLRYMNFGRKAQKVSWDSSVRNNSGSRLEI